MSILQHFVERKLRTGSWWLFHHSWLLFRRGRWSESKNTRRRAIIRVIERRNASPSGARGSTTPSRARGSSTRTMIANLDDISGPAIRHCCHSSRGTGSNHCTSIDILHGDETHGYGTLLRGRGRIRTARWCWRDCCCLIDWLDHSIFHQFKRFTRSFRDQTEGFFWWIWRRNTPPRWLRLRKRGLVGRGSERRWGWSGCCDGQFSPILLRRLRGRFDFGLLRSPRRSSHPHGLCGFLRRRRHGTVVFQQKTWKMQRYLSWCKVRAK